MLSHRVRSGILAGIALLAVVVLAWFDPIAQDPKYHAFADSRQLFGVNNFWNVASNLAFVLVGIAGLERYRRLSPEVFADGYIVLCAAAMLIGLGSGYYHLAPSNATLLWDRLPMTVAFMALLSLLLAERVIASRHRATLWLLVACGAGSAIYWAWTESIGKGDLRPYVLVQFLPVALIPLTVALFQRRYMSNSLLLCAFALYVAAKVAEHFDGQVLLATGVMGGHAIKHLIAAAGMLCVVRAVR